MEFRIPWSGRAHDYLPSEIAAVVEVMKSADPQTQGKYLRQFESDFASFLDQPNCYGVTNCTHALELTADLIGLRDGDEVILPSHTYCASAIPFGRTGAKLVWADIDRDSFVVSASSIEKRITSRTKAIVVVHLYGLLVDMDAVMAVARRHGIPVIEDVAQAIGATRNGKRAGTWGDYACFSFHGQKNMTTMGEGGVLVVKDPAKAKLVPGLRHNGHIAFENQKNYWEPAMTNVNVNIDGVWPHNFSMMEAQAALASQLLKRVDVMNSERRERSLRFQKEFSDFPELVFQVVDDPKSHVHHLLPARYDGQPYGKTRSDLIALLSQKHRIKAIVQYYPLNRYDLFRKMGFGAAECPNTDAFYDNMISFPFHHWMNEQDFSYLIESVRSSLLELRRAGK